MSNDKPSRWWPYIKGLAKLVSGFGETALPGSSAGMQFLTDLQDDLAKKSDETQSGIKDALKDIRDNTAEIVRRLAAESLVVTDDELRTAAQEIAEALYLRRVADDYVYADFKGIEQQERVASLKLDEIFVDLKAVPERRAEGERGSPFSENTLQKLKIIVTTNFDSLIERAFEQAGMSSFDSREKRDDEIESLKDTRANPQPIDHILSRSGGIVLMGGPGSGKTTLVKRLARSCALGPDELKQRYPQLLWCFPIVLPITTFQTERGERDLFRFIRDWLIERGGETLDDLFVEYWAAGQCLVLLDGLDEVADLGSRIAAAKAIDQLLLPPVDNRVVVTTRQVGYNITRLSVPAEHHILEPWSPQEIATFVRQWYLAYDRALHPERPDAAQAERDAQSLIDDVQKNPGVAGLATNPLMLTIIALIKHANVVLPERRVELYEIALNTLLRSWNRARSLSKRPTGEEPKLEKTRKVWAAVAYWMQQNVSRTVPRAKLHERIVQVLTEDFREPPHQADEIAESYLAAAAERSGLLEARGPNTFAFVHQTFQEYLAALHLATPTDKAVRKILAVAQNPRWHEAIRLAAGHLVIHQGDFDRLRDLMHALLEDADPLEPYLSTSLRLAAACLSDKVGVETAESDRVIVKLFERLTGHCYKPVWEAFLQSLPGLAVVPGESAIATLCQATGNENWRIRQEAARLLARLPVPAGEALLTLQRLFEKDRDDDVKAHAAWGLWQSNQRRDRDVALAVAYGVPRGLANMQLGPQPTLIPVLVELLQDPDSDVRFRAASVLGGWGPQAQAVPVLVELLKDPDRNVRFRAASVLGGWGPQAQAVPVLVELLKDPDRNVRIRAASVLGGWGHQAQAVPVLVELLKDPDSDVRFSAASVLGGWGHQAQAVPVLVELLKDPDRGVRIRAADVLGGWGQQAQAVPVLVELLKDPDRGVRIRAASVLGGWGQQAEAVPVLIELLKDPDRYVRFGAAEVSGGWGHQAQAVPVLVELLKDPDRYVRFGAAEVLGGWGHQAQAVPVLVEWLQDPDSDVRSRAASVLGGWGHQAQAVPVLVEWLQDPDSDVRIRAASVLGGWGKDETVVRTVVHKLFPRSKTDAELVVQFLIDAPHGGPKPRSATVNPLLAKALKPNGGDSNERQALREILFRWTWDALATTA